MIALRPVLGLLAAGDERLEVALKGEIEFWNQLDRLRIRCMSTRCVPTCWPSNATAVPTIRHFTPNIWSASNMPSVCCRSTRCANTDSNG